VEIEGAEQFPGNPRILGGNQLDLAQDLQGAWTEILQIAYGSRNQVQGAHDMIVSPRIILLTFHTFLEVSLLEG
jgi:hypothetical protein